MSQEQFITTTIDGPIFLITINRPPTNAIHPQTLAELDVAVNEFIANPTYKVAMIYGGDQAVFSTGADTFEFNHLVESGKVADFVQAGQVLFQKISESTKPFIAAVNGLTLGGGFELVMACHLRVVAERAKFGLPEINLGILPAWGGTQRLPQIVGRAKALEWILTGENISAQEALQFNLANLVVPRAEVLPRARELAEKIIQKSDLAVRAVLEAVKMSHPEDMRNGLAFEARQMSGLIGSEKVRESLRVIAEKQRSRRAI